MLPLAVAAVWFGSPYLPALVVLAAAGMGWEWARLSDGASPVVATFVVATAVAAAAATAVGAVVVAILVSLCGGIVVWGASLAAKTPAPFWTALGTLWLSLPCVAILAVAAGTDGRASILWLLAVVWASDSGAYAFGRAIGGKRLAPRLSPNKTWAGALGGLLCAGLVGVAAAWLVGGTVAIVAAVSVLLSVTAQGGDLAESYAKRRFGAKDSGGLIPGHGGLLDRLDSLLTAATMLGLLMLLGAGSPLDWHF